VPTFVNTTTTSPSISNTIAQFSFDGYSCLINGQRQVIRSASFHYFRLPNPRLWKERLLRLKQAGYNTIDLYLCWSFHSPAAGQYDFSGIRDLARLFETVAELGFWMIVRPGPYINAEISGGGLPEWVITDPTMVARCRKNGQHSQSPPFLSAVEEWWRSVFPFFVKAPNLLWIQVENEYATEGMEPEYMLALVALAKRLGATCPLSHNDLYGYGSFSDVIDLYALDHYPITELSADWKPTASELLAQTDLLEDQVKPIVPHCPLHIAESQAGWFTSWKGLSYKQVLDRLGTEAFRLINKSLLAQGVTIFNHYHAAGGTNWGYLGSTDTITSYDFAAIVGEQGDLRLHFYEALQLNNLLASFPALASTQAVSLEGASVSVSNPALCLKIRRNTESINETNQNEWVFLRNLSQLPQSLTFTSKADPAEAIAITIPPWDVLILPWHQPLQFGWMLNYTTTPILYQSCDTLWVLGDKPAQVKLTSPTGKVVNVTLEEAVDENTVKIKQVGSFFIAWVGSASLLPFQPELDAYYQQSFQPLKPSLLVPITDPLAWEFSTKPLTASSLNDTGLLGIENSPSGVIGSHWWRYAFSAETPLPESLKLQAGHLWKLYLNNTLLACNTVWEPNSKGKLEATAEVELAPILASNWRANQPNYLWLYTDSFGRTKGFHDDLEQTAGVQTLSLNGQAVLEKLHWVGHCLPMEQTCQSELWINASLTIPRNPSGEAPLAFQLSLPKQPLAERVDIYLGGVLMGKYWSECQAQTVFYLPLLPCLVKESQTVVLSLKCVAFADELRLDTLVPLLPQLHLLANYPSVS
jgi:Glycosyl hydrolases family 35